MLGNYSKIVGSIVGALAGALVSFGILPDQLATPEIQTSIVGILSAVFTFFFPANKSA